MAEAIKPRRIDGPTGTDKCYALTFDNGYHTDYWTDYPPESEIQDAREAAPDAWTTVEFITDGWKSETVHSWPPLESDPRADA